jgi:Ca-activated chloride channel homolog
MRGGGGFMRNLRNQLFILPSVLSAMLILTLFVPDAVQQPVLASTSSEGSLQMIKGGKTAGFCPLKHTDVKGGISGFIARVTVTQEFENPSTEKIEAVYTFPLPQDSAVDDMTITIGSRTIIGQIKRREEAAAIYKHAIQQGKIAALLDQERPNIFTQTVGNIPPGEKINVSISYTMRLKYEDGAYEFSFPMVVGPRYIPGSMAIGKQGGGVAPDTNQVPDASRITPPIAPPGTRAGHDISIALNLDAGVPIQDLRSTTHQIDVDRTGASSAIVRLHNESEIPNKDFIIRYNVAGGAIAEGLITHTNPMPIRLVPASLNGSAATANGYFTLILQPPDRFRESDVTPKELVFVIDSSGSMGGFPIEKSKRLIDHAIDGLYPGDTFNVIKFSGDTAILFDEPVDPTAANVRKAKDFVNANWGGHGTEMMKAIRAALAPSDSQDHLRIVVFLTDGYVGNDMEIISEVQKHPNARVFAYGIGSSVNRFLLDKMAEAGCGEVEYVSAKEDEKEAKAAANRLYERLRAPLLTDISIDFGSLPVAEVYPQKIRDLFSARPVIITGRYTAGAEGTIRLKGKRAGEPYVREIPVSFPALQSNNPAVASLWAREKIDDLMSQDWNGAQQGEMKKDLREQITNIGLEYRLMTQFTSFVAVEERVVTEGGQPKRIQVPVELPEDVQYEEGWSDKRADAGFNAPAKSKMMTYLAAPSPASGGGVGAGYGGGVGSGVSGGVLGGIVSNASPKLATPQRVRISQEVSAGQLEKQVNPTYPPLAKQARIQGEVVLRAVVDKTGTISSLRVVSGHPMLAPAAIEAVKQWKYKPYLLNGTPVEVETLISVNFNLTSGVTSSSGAAQATVGAPTTTPLRTIDTKLSPTLVAAYDCWLARADKSKASTACKLTNDKVLVRVIVTGDPAAALQQLQAAGFEPQPGVARSKQFVGRIAVEKLAALADIAAVKFVRPESLDGKLTARKRQ